MSDTPESLAIAVGVMEPAYGPREFVCDVVLAVAAMVLLWLALILAAPVWA